MKTKTFITRLNIIPEYKLVIPITLIAKFSQAINSRKNTELLIEQILTVWQTNIGLPGYFTVEDKTNDKMFTYQIEYVGDSYNLEIIETEDAITINLFDNKQFDFEIKKVDSSCENCIDEINNNIKNC